MLYVRGVATIILSKQDLAWKGVGERIRNYFSLSMKPKE
jgi:hypothetical protein